MVGMGRRQKILESNYGRNLGWYVEVERQRLAVLTDVQWVDMFWDSYRLEPLTNDLEMLYSDQFWDRCDRIPFRSREFEEVAPNAFPCGKAGTLLRQTGRISMRGLYLPVPCFPWDNVLLWFIRLARKT